MKARPTTALALVGWYLMASPRVSESPLVFDTGSPLNKWKIVGSYDTANDCDDGKREIFAPLLKFLLQAPPGRGKVDALNSLMITIDAMECISTDDPRLKGK